MLQNSAAELADVIPQSFQPREGLLLQLVHVVGCTAAPPLAGEGTVAVPLVTGQRFGPFNWEKTERWWKTAAAASGEKHVREGLAVPATYAQHPAESGWRWTGLPRDHREIAPPTGIRVELQIAIQ